MLRIKIKGIWDMEKPVIGPHRYTTYQELFTEFLIEAARKKLHQM